MNRDNRITAEMQKKRGIVRVAAAGLLGLTALLAALPVHAADAGPGVNAEFILATALAPEALETHRAGGLDAGSALDPLQGQDLAVILWDELAGESGGNGGSVSTGGASVSLTSVVSY